MKYFLDEEFRNIYAEIVNQGKTVDEWIEVESSDMFQSQNYCGGFDGIENEFCFSIYVDSKEFWFQVSLNEVMMIVNGQLDEIEIRNAD